MKCRLLLLAVGLGLLVAPSLFGQSSPPLKPITLLLDWFPQAEQGGYYDALARGLYQEEGLNVTIVPATAGQVGATMLLSDIAQFGLGTSDANMIARSRGLPLVALMTTMQHDPKAILLHTESPVKTFADLNGHAIEARPDSAWFLYLVKRYNLKNMRQLRGTENVSLFLHDPSYIQECFITSEPFFVQQHGETCRTLLVKDTGYDPYRILYTTDDYMNKNPDIVKAFVKASIAGWTHYMQDPTAAFARILKCNPEMTQAQMEFTFKALKESKVVEGDPSQGDVLGQQIDSRYDAMYKILRNLNMIDHEIDYKKSYRTDLVPTPK